jgi:DNA invertase Pin-like site-specific DNA recombinase
MGYARVSTGEQELALQHDALTGAGCLRIFSDTASGSLDERVELARLLDHLRAGDTLVVWRLDRLGRSLRHLVDTGHRARRPRRRVPVAAGEHRHDHAGRPPGLPRVRRAGGVRARPDP